MVANNHTIANIAGHQYIVECVADITVDVHITLPSLVALNPPIIEAMTHV